MELSQEQLDSAKKISEYMDKADIHDNLPIVEELSSIDDCLENIHETLKAISEKPEKEVQQVELKGVSIVTIQGEKGENGDTPIKGKDYFTQSEIEQFKKDVTPVKGKDYKDGYTPIKGKDYFDGETPVKGVDYFTKEELREIKKEITPVKDVDYRDGKDGSSDTGEQIIDKINQDESNKLIKKEKVEGLQDSLDTIDNKISSIPRGGGSRGIHTYVNGVKKGLVQYIDIVQGSNMTVSSQLSNGLLTLTFASTGGSGFTQLSATETPNGVLTVFTFASATAQPSFIVVDNVWLKPTTALGTVNWTWNNGTKKATLTVPATDDIWGVV